MPARKRGSNPDAVTGAVLVASGLKAVPHHACPDARNTLWRWHVNYHDRIRIQFSVTP
jgi:hypothetical protein